MGKKILVVDDEQAIADLIEVYLAGEGWEVIKCDNGTDAVRCVEEEELSMAILDVMLPDIDGFSPGEGRFLPEPYLSDKKILHCF